MGNQYINFFSFLIENEKKVEIPIGNDFGLICLFTIVDAKKRFKRVIIF